MEIAMFGENKIISFSFLTYLCATEQRKAMVMAMVGSRLRHRIWLQRKNANFVLVYTIIDCFIYSAWHCCWDGWLAGLRDETLEQPWPVVRGLRAVKWYWKCHQNGATTRLFVPSAALRFLFLLRSDDVAIFIFLLLLFYFGVRHPRHTSEIALCYLWLFFARCRKIVAFIRFGSNCYEGVTFRVYANLSY